MDDNRDQTICQLYRDGKTIRKISRELDIPRQRVTQILQDNDAIRRKANKSKRSEYIGINISESDKHALRQEAARRGMSMSALTADWIKERLDRRRASADDQGVDAVPGGKA